MVDFLTEPSKNSGNLRGGVDSADFQQMLAAVSTIPVSTAECERCFSDASF